MTDGNESPKPADGVVLSRPGFTVARGCVACSNTRPGLTDKTLTLTPAKAALPLRSNS